MRMKIKANWRAAVLAVLLPVSFVYLRVGIGGAAIVAIVVPVATLMLVRFSPGAWKEPSESVNHAAVIAVLLVYGSVAALIVWLEFGLGWRGPFP